jgi:hypothetical protein
MNPLTCALCGLRHWLLVIAYLLSCILPYGGYDSAQGAAEVADAGESMSKAMRLPRPLDTAPPETLVQEPATTLHATLRFTQGPQIVAPGDSLRVALTVDWWTPAPDSQAALVLELPPAFSTQAGESG